jgi:hypothetical protein
MQAGFQSDFPGPPDIYSLLTGEVQGPSERVPVCCSEAKTDELFGGCVQLLKMSADRITET